MGGLKDNVRAQLLPLVERRILSSSGPARERAWRLLRRLDDRHDTRTRAMMRRLFDIEVGRLTYGAFRIDGSILAGSRIGAFCSVAPGVRLGGVEHPTGFVSTHPFLWLRNRGFIERDSPAFKAEYTTPIVIEDDVWLGANAIVANGVRVGRGAIVGAGAVVTKDVAPYAIVAGVPARQIGERFPPEQAAALAEIDWPRWDDARIKAELADFYDVAAFIERHGARERDAVS